MVAAAVIGGVALAGSAVVQSNAASKAAKAQVAGQQQALDAQERIYQDQKATLTPGILAGANAASRMQLMTGTSEADAQRYLNDQYAALGASDAPSISGWNAQSWLESTPGYQFRRDQGQLGLERSAAARGGLFSGGTGRALARYNSDYASNEWGNLYNQLGDIAGAGQRNTGAVVNVQGDYGDNQARAYTNMGNARATGYQAQGQAWSDALGVFGGAMLGGFGGGFGGGGKSGFGGGGGFSGGGASTGGAWGRQVPATWGYG